MEMDEFTGRSPGPTSGLRPQRRGSWKPHTEATARPWELCAPVPVCTLLSRLVMASPTNPGPCTNRVTINSLPEDVLLEIFEAYRQDMELLPRYKTIWNCKDGWFKLTHVCPRWRRVVHLSPTRLHVHLLFTVRKSSRVSMLKCLPPFPVLVDFRGTSWTDREERLAQAALRYRSRVRGIVLRRWYPDMVKLLRPLRHTLPELESLKLCLISAPEFEQSIFPAMFLSGSAPCLRRLTLRKFAPRCLSPLLSFATGLVEITLTLHTERGLPLEDSLLSNLQRMSCLRYLELDLIYSFGNAASNPPPPVGTGDVVSLSKLTHLIFRGHRLHLQALVVGLAAPSLQHFDAELSGPSRFLLHLSKFIRDTGCHFTAVRLVFSYPKFELYARTGSQSVDEQHFRLIIPEPVSLERMGQELSEPLSTVEELIVVLADPPFTENHFPSQWRGFFYHVPQVKMVQVPSREALNVARSFMPDGQEPAMDLLPILEQVKVDMSMIDRSHNSIRGAFEPLIAARHQVGRPITITL